eukprot:COSAG06_NODE_2128_length_7534_cov_2.020713_5_plen_55_part_00
MMTLGMSPPVRYTSAIYLASSTVTSIAANYVSVLVVSVVFIIPDPHLHLSLRFI